MRIQTPRTANDSSYLLLEIINDKPYEMKVTTNEGGGVIGLDPLAQKSLAEIEECLNAIVNLKIPGNRPTEYSFSAQEQSKNDFTRFRAALKNAGSKKRALEIFRQRVSSQLQNSTGVALGADPAFPFQPVMNHQNFVWVYAAYLCVDLMRERAIKRLKRCKVCKHLFWDSSMAGNKRICWVEPAFVEFDTKPTPHKDGPRYYALYRKNAKRSGCLCGKACFDERNAKRMRLKRKGK
jgi:hypothetical protein